MERWESLECLEFPDNPDLLEVLEKWVALDLPEQEDPLVVPDQRAHPGSWDQLVPLEWLEIRECLAFWEQPVLRVRQVQQGHQGRQDFPV